VVYVTAPGGGDSADAATSAKARLASTPCIVLAVERDPAATPELADAVIDPAVATLDDVLAVIGANPISATSLALLLRGAGGRTEGAGLVAESATYSSLQSGPEFAAWRAGRPIVERREEEGPAVRIERDGSRLDLVLDRPQVRNALDRRVRDGLLAGLDVAAADPSIAEVVLRGEGSSFCSGGDLDEFGSFPDPASAHLVRLTASIGRAISALGTRVRAEVHGPCAGSGVELPAFAARVVATPDFTASLPEVTLGLVPGAGGTVSVTRRAGRHRTALLALSGARIDAGTALAWGLVDDVAAS
jgi:hypothetical protein